MTFEQWWDTSDMDSVPDYSYTSSEVVWKAAQKSALADVLNVLRDNPEATTVKLAATMERVLASPVMS